MELLELVKNMQQRLMPLFQKTPEKANERCAVGVSQQRVSVLAINTASADLQLLYSESVQREQTSLETVFTQLVEEHDLAHTSTAWLLQPDDYQLFLIDSLPVPQDEFQQALQWRIRSLISYPPEEATLDHFTIPAKKSSPGSPMIAAVTAKTDMLKQMLKSMKKSEMHINNIYIPELALRNLSGVYEADERSTAMVYFHDTTIILNITRQKTLFFTRRLTWGNPDQPNTTDCEQICLDLQRYFDYFQTQWRLPSPTRVFVISQKGNAETIAGILAQLLALTVEAYVYPLIAYKQEKIKITKAQSLLLLGCTIREKA